VKPKRLPQLEKLGPLISALGDETIPLELFVAKAHLLIERQLYALLALRLRVDERELPEMSFYLLANLALVGDEYSHALAEVLALNRLRNEYAHELEDTRVKKRIGMFAKQAGVFVNDFFDSATYGRAARMAAGFCLGDVWCHFTEYAIANDLFPSKDAKNAAEAELAAFRLLHRNQCKFEESLSVTVGWLVEELENYLHPGVVPKQEPGKSREP
jgi:hypothetical protein